MRRSFSEQERRERRKALESRRIALEAGLRRPAQKHKRDGAVFGEDDPQTVRQCFLDRGEGWPRPRVDQLRGRPDGTPAWPHAASAAGMSDTVARAACCPSLDANCAT